MIKSYWTTPDLTPEQHKQYRKAAVVMRKAAESEPGKTIRIDINDIV